MSLREARLKKVITGLWSQTQEQSEVSKNGLLDRGWTKTMIRRLLGAPDRMREFRHFRTRGVLRKDRPECLYSMRRILDAEYTPEFLTWKAKLDRIRGRDKSDGLQFESIPRHGRPLWGWETEVPRYAKVAYGALSDRDRQIVLLLFQQGRRQREVARALGVSQQTVSLVKTLFVAQCKVPSIEDYIDEDYRAEDARIGKS